MTLESLIARLGTAGFVAMLITLATPLGVIGLLLRRRAMRSIERFGAAEAVRRAVRDVHAGDVTLIGEWHALAPGRGLIAADGAEAIVEHPLDRSPLFDSAQVSVFGRAVRRAPDPRGGYRAPHLWVIEAHDAAHFVRVASTDPGRERRRSRVIAALGAALLALSLGAVVAGGMIAVREDNGWSNEVFDTHR
jgi:hypothetical protein